MVWYPRLLPRQIGSGARKWTGRLRQDLKRRNHVGQQSNQGICWLTGSAICILAATSLSPNKDVRYIALLPLLSIILARGWLILLVLGTKQWQRAIGVILVLLVSLLSAVELIGIRWNQIRSHPGSPAADVIERIRELGENRDITVLMAVSNGIQ